MEKFDGIKIRKGIWTKKLSAVKIICGVYFKIINVWKIKNFNKLRRKSKRNKEAVVIGLKFGAKAGTAMLRK